MDRQAFFATAFDGESVPPRLRGFVEALCVRADINGTADPMYVANVVAHELGLGNGCGAFTKDLDDSLKDRHIVERVASRLYHTYWTCLIRTGMFIEDVGAMLTKAALA